jgi:hypothetical protein
VIHAQQQGDRNERFRFRYKRRINFREIRLFKPLFRGRGFRTGKAFQIGRKGTGNAPSDPFLGGGVQAVQFRKPAPFFS